MREDINFEIPQHSNQLAKILPQIIMPVANKVQRWKKGKARQTDISLFLAPFFFFFQSPITIAPPALQPHKHLSACQGRVVFALKNIPAYRRRTVTDTDTNARLFRSTITHSKDKKVYIQKERLSFVQTNNELQTIVQRFFYTRRKHCVYKTDFPYQGKF